MHGRRRSSLMAVQIANAFLSVNSSKVRTNPFRHRSELRFARRDMMHGGKHFARAVPRGKLFDDFAHPCKCDRVARRPRRQKLGHPVPPLQFAFCSLKLTRRAEVCNAQSKEKENGTTDEHRYTQIKIKKRNALLGDNLLLRFQFFISV